MLSSGNRGADTPNDPHAHVKIDSFLAGQLKISQQPKGHRIGTDAMLLAASLDVDEGLALDIGAGVGAVGLACAIMHPHLQVGLVEYDPEVAALAAVNIAQNKLERRVRLFELDICHPAQRRAAGFDEIKGDVIITNPPFFDPAQARLSPDPQKRKAHAYSESQSDPARPHSGLDAWMRACVAVSAPNARLVMIHRADALPALLEVLKGRYGAVEIVPVFSRPDRPAIRVLVRGRLGSRGPISLHPPLILHEPDGSFTHEARDINEGRKGVPFLPS